MLKHMGGPRFVYDAITQSMHPIASAATAEQLGRRLATAAAALHESTKAILSPSQWINFALYSYLLLPFVVNMLVYCVL